MEYAELHCHSSFSLLDGASNPEELVFYAKKLGIKALAITDHDDIGGVVRFAEAAKEASFDGLLGAELTLADESHLTLLVEDLNGYKNLSYLITRARSASARGLPKVSLDDLAKYSTGLIALSGCPHGAIPHQLALANISEAERLTNQLREIFPNGFYYELWDHGLHQETVICKQLFDLSQKLSIPCLVTNNVHYATRSKRVVHDVLTCLKHEVTLSGAGRRLRPNDNWCLRSPKEMSAHWQAYPEFLQNTLLVAERCQFRLFALKPSLPHFPTPDDLTYDEFLERLVWLGAKRLLGSVSEAHKKQVEHELAVIKRMQFAPYFLIMWDIVEFARSKGILVQGRGSAANSVVCYCLSITAVDPVANDLLFERFISEGRDEPPDIDLDIAHQHREIVLQYVYEKYGREHAGMVCETITYRGRSAVRDAARVLGFSQEQAEKLANQSHYSEAGEAAESLATGGVQQAGLDIHDKRVQTLIRVVAGLDRLPRHRSIHVGGFVLSGEPLGMYVPIEPASMQDRTVIQWDKDDLGPVGMFKIDLLGLGMLSMIQEAMRLIKIHRNIDFEMAKLNMQDDGVFKMLQEADTVGIFQIESRAQMAILPKLHPEKFYDIVVSIALIRPGPIQGKIVHPYLKRRRGLEPVTYLHPSLEPVLERTLGVPLFQEQGMRLAVIAGGFTPLQADQLRRVMSFKRSKERMSEICIELANGMRKNGFLEEAIEPIIMQLQAFANYGFPESHSASFALLAYASAYLKRYYAPEFYCSMLNAQPLGFYSPNTLIRDAIRHNVKVLPIDLAKSQWDCTLEEFDALAASTDDTTSNSACHEPFALRIGLHYIKSLGIKAKALLEKAWHSGGPFTSAEDVCRRSGLGWKTLQVLATAGAFESFIPGRRQALWEIIAMSKRQNLPLFKDVKYKNDSTKTLNIPTMNELELTIADYQTQLFSVFEHIMKYYRPWAEQHGMKSCKDLQTIPSNEYVTLAAGVICRQKPGTAKGFMFFTLEDETGLANIIIKPRLLKTYKEILLHHNFLAISGRIQNEDGVVNLVAHHVESLPELIGRPKLASRDFH
jgi:error-prone DNA polymerase